jgi:protein-S-isoprenylcysteine O-methyltransferase Ste14
MALSQPWTSMLAGWWRSALVLTLAVTYYAVDTTLMKRYDRLRSQGTARSWSYTLFICAVTVLVAAQPVLWPALSMRIDGWPGLLIQAGGMTLLVAALALHWWARVHLGRFFAEREEVQAGQEIVQTGPYSHIRHPIYLSFFTIAVGLLLVAPGLPTLIAAFYVFVDFSRAIRREESLLSASLPGYWEYMKRTPRFLPRWSRPPDCG